MTVSQMGKCVFSSSGQQGAAAPLFLNCGCYLTYRVLTSIQGESNLAPRGPLSCRVYLQHTYLKVFSDPEELN